MGARDRAAGLLTIALGAAVAAAARGFPNAAGQPVGPAAFPAAIGLALAAAGALLLFQRARHSREPAAGAPHWMRSPHLAMNVLIALAGVVLYALLLDWLGFLITAILLLTALFARFGVPGRRILPLSILVTLTIHVVFYTLLRVPLPWGVLEAIAW
jgi:putative tricarboxylic transport membrane protein